MWRARCRTSLSSSLASLLGDTIAAALFTEEPLQTFPSCTQISYLGSATQTQALTTSHCSEPGTAGECHQFRVSNDLNAAAQDPSESAMDPTIGASVTPLLLLSTSDQLSDMLYSQSKEANQQHASSLSAQSVADTALAQLPLTTLDQSRAQQSGLVQSQLSKVSQHVANSQTAHSATVIVTDSGTAGVARNVSSGSGASYTAWQHHSCGGSGQTGKGGLPGQNDKALGSEQGRDFVSAEDSLADSSDAASACRQASTACSRSSSTACPSSSSNSSSSSRSQGISGIACLDSQTSSAASQAAVALSPSGSSAAPGDCETAQLWTTAAEGGKQLPTKLLLAVFKQESLAFAMSNESVDGSAAEGVQSSKADSSASGGVQSSLRNSSTSHDAQTSIADSSASEGVQSSIADSSALHDAETSTMGSAAGDVPAGPALA